MLFSVALQASLCCLGKAPHICLLYHSMEWFPISSPICFQGQVSSQSVGQICDTILAVSVFLIHDSLLSNARFFHHFMHFSCTYSIPYITSEVSIFNGFRWLYWCLKQSLFNYFLNLINNCINIFLGQVWMHRQ